jgi:hypothetical protein
MQKLKEKAPVGVFGGFKAALLGTRNLVETVETDKGED